MDGGVSFEARAHSGCVVVDVARVEGHVTALDVDATALRPRKHISQLPNTEAPTGGRWEKGSEEVQRARAHVISLVAMDLACIERYVAAIDSDTSTL